MKSLPDYFQAGQPEILDLIHKIVEIESPSNDVEGSRAVVDFLVGEFEKISLDLQIERIAAEGVGEHLIVRAFENTNAKCAQDGATQPILLLGHTDTVHPVGAKLQNPTRIVGDKFYGGGIFDMKANCVLMLETLRAFAELNLQPTRPLTILLSCDEETGSQTGREIVEREAANAAFCYVCEPSANGKVKTGRKGTANYILKAHGVPAHAGLEPEKGASAILEIARQIERIHSLNNPEIGTTANVCTVEGGTTTNVIPEHAMCSIDVRFSSMAEAARIETAMTNLQSFDAKVSLELSGGLNRPPLERTASVINLYEKARNIAAQNGYELGETQVGGASDGNFVAALGVPVLDGLGISGGGAHTYQEFIFVDDVPKRAALLTALILAD